MKALLLNVAVFGALVCKRVNGEVDPTQTPAPPSISAKNLEEFFSDDHGHDAAGLVASAKCDKSSGQCYVVDKNGHLTLDNEKDIHDYRRIKTTNSSNVNDLHLSIINLAARQADQTKTVEQTVQEQVQQRMTLHHLLTYGSLLGLALFILLVWGAKKLYQDKFSPSAAARAEARRAWTQINDIYELNPEHCVLLMRVLLNDNTISWCRKHLADMEAGHLSERHNQVRVDELERLMKMRARESQLFQGHQYIHVPPTAP